MRHLVLSDIHGNLPALDAVLYAAEGDYDDIWCLGDVVGYGANPVECIRLLQSFEAKCVRGNHDEVVVGDRTKLSHFNEFAWQAAAWTIETLEQDSETWAWLESQPVGPIILNNGQVMLVHGSPRDPIWEYTDYWEINIIDRAVQVAYPDVKLVFFGHTHVPTHIQARSGRMYINPGSVGQPRDGHPDAAYIIFDDVEGVWEYYREPYDIDEAAGNIINAGLPAAGAYRLYDGR